ncbi:MAG: hypothetical protein DRJ61_10540 [Acidobacteria bacterium]|nr:MAG: hypothetical protein DRJ65_05890 [Acidobacteriota bacterium]RLE31993.1 MAG: hypothetical protein DRJ61_10540 [Acidobacteriota bacterium]
MPKVLLYQPRCVFYTMPLALMAVGSGLKNLGIETVIVDGRLEDDPISALVTHLDDSLCLGISVLTGSTIRDALEIGGRLKSLRPDLPVVWGGWHPSLFPKEILDEAPEVDIVVRVKAKRHCVNWPRHGSPGARSTASPELPTGTTMGSS